jgi:hypothetical protein
MTKSRPFSRRDFLKVTGLTIAGTAFSACNSLLLKPRASGEENIRLVYQDFNDNWFTPMAQELLEQFHVAQK